MAAALLPLVACGAPSSDVDLAAAGLEQSPIINGEACVEDDPATAVAILVDAVIEFGGFGQQPTKTVVCTGTLIAPDTVLTAAHCLDATALTMGFGTVISESYYISFEHDLTALAEQQSQQFPADALPAVDWVIHPDFDLQQMSGQNVNGPGNFSDVGLLFLELPVEDIDPEVVITPREADQIEPGTEVYIAGWGQQTQTSGPFDPPPPGTVGKKVCAETFINEVGPHEMQIGGDADTSRKCHGDSGGPTYLHVDTEHVRSRRVVGVTSHAYDASDCAKGGVDTRVDAWYDWIDDTMKEGCADGTRKWCEVEGVIKPSFYDPEADDGDVKGATDDGIAPPGAGLIPGCSHIGPSGDGEGSEPTFALLALGGLALLAGRRRRR
jgi:MYXO-CTERM domain-containing protein